MIPEEVAAAQLVYEEMTETMTDLSFGYFKREVEALLGRQVFASEAQAMWTIVSTPDGE